MLCALVAGFNVNAVEDLDNVTMEITTKEVKRGHKLHFAVKEILQLTEEYMLEKGDITADEMAARKAERETQRAELKALKESGNTAELETRLAEIKAQREERKASLREYIDNNEELKTAIQERKEQLKEKMKEEHKSRKEEKRQERKNNNG